MLNAVRVWILLSTLLVASGWILSAMHQLNPAGYGAVFVAAVIAMFLWQRQAKWRPFKNPGRLLGRFRSRFKRGAPLLFLALAALTVLAGALYAPANGSSTAYRIPRVMHWLAAGQWHWIHTLDVRTNIAGQGFEWLCAPLLLLTRSDRCLFLVNWLPFLLLPGLIFSVFTRLGVRRRVAWWWMWLLPSGWCFIMEANSTINDAFGTAYALAAVDLALRAGKNRSFGDAWLALLAAALATGVKQTGILAAVPGLIALWPCARWLFRRPSPSLAIIALGLLVSALPMMVLNWKHTGSWVGVSAESALWNRNELHSPLWGVAGNAFCLAAQNLKPPVFPFLHAWDAAREHFLQTPFGSHFREFENFGRLSFGVSETSAGIGMGITLMLLLSVVAAWHYRRRAGASDSPGPLPMILRWTPWALLLVFMAKVGTYENGRSLAPYYFFLFPALLAAPGQSILVRRRWWQFLARFVLLLAMALIVISRDRPLFPAEQVAAWLKTKYPDSGIAHNIALSYGRTVDFERQRVFLWQTLPPGERVLGYAADGGEAESTMWLPFGCRRIQRILPGDTPEQLQSAGIHYVVVERFYLDKTGDDLAQWLARFNGLLIKQWIFPGDPYGPPQVFYLVRLQKP
jgi:hypothetical protein